MVLKIKLLIRNSCSHSTHFFKKIYILRGLKKISSLNKSLQHYSKDEKHYMNSKFMKLKKRPHTVYPCCFSWEEALSCQEKTVIFCGIWSCRHSSKKHRETSSLLDIIIPDKDYFSPDIDAEGRFKV